jgi:hypothetical protein
MYKKFPVNFFSCEKEKISAHTFGPAGWEDFCDFFYRFFIRTQFENTVGFYRKRKILLVGLSPGLCRRCRLLSLKNFTIILLLQMCIHQKGFS